MKVGISYAVELEEIPAEVEDLIRDVQWDLLGILENIIKDINAGDFSTVFTDINNLRKHVHKLDTRLEDCYTILGGYLKVRQQLAERAAAAAVEPIVTEIGPGHKLITPPVNEDDIND